MNCNAGDGLSYEPLTPFGLHLGRRLTIRPRNLVNGSLAAILEPDGKPTDQRRSGPIDIAGRASFERENSPFDSELASQPARSTSQLMGFRRTESS